VSERSDRTRVVKALRPLDGIPVENSTYPGTPDVNYVEGWLELKWKMEWPRRPDTIVQFRKFYRVQRMWLAKRWEARGNAHLLLHVQQTQDWLLFTGEVAARLVGYACQAQLREGAVQAWQGRQMDQEIAECLSRRMN